MDIKEKRIKIEDADLVLILGYNDSYLRMIENKFQSTITVRGSEVIIKGEAEELKDIEKIFKELSYMVKRNGALEENDVSTVLDLISGPGNGLTANIDKDTVIYVGNKSVIRARNPKQVEYLRKVNSNDLILTIGPAGTGKTFLAVAMALAALKNNRVSKIILSRPAVEAGESLGFLPGDLREKLDPYLRPLLDALFIMLSADKLKNMMEKNIIEIIPLAYMRGRTLSNSFIILDEAQNSTITQMKMFLTRLGENSKAIVTGDITQIDLQNKKQSGLVDARKVLRNIEGIDFVYFDNKDVIRHRLVAEIINAYEKNAEENEIKS